MKTWLLFLGIICINGMLAGQEAVITLTSPHNGGETYDYQARDEVRLKPGFLYSPQGANLLHARIDEDMVLPVSYSDEPIGADERELNLSLPVGSLAGSFDVSATGAATYTIPIAVPPGTAGMQPSVSMVYNSQAGNGLLGYGWNLSGLSSITRIGHTIYHDGEIKGVNFNDDRFALDGNRLVVITGDYGADQSVYYTENFNASKITSHKSAIGGGPLYFTVETKDGKTIEYGNTDDSRVETEPSMLPHVITWNINKIIDRKGNYIEFVYHKSYDHTQYRIKEIRYTGNDLVNPALEPYNTIHFYYSERYDKHTTYIAGSKLQSNVLLDHIKVFAGQSLVRNYILKYYYDFYSHLIEVQEFNGLGQRYNSTVFEYFEEEGAFDTINLPHQYSEANYTYGDFTGDGKVDYVIYPKMPIPNSKWHLYESNGSGGFDSLTSGVLTENFTNMFGGEYTVFRGGTSTTLTTDGLHFVSAKLCGNNAIDFNGDGYDDLLWREIIEEPGIDPFYAYFFKTYDPINQTFNATQIGLYVLLDHAFFLSDFDGDKKTDFFASEFNESKFKWNLSTIGYKEDTRVPCIDNGYLGDFNGNGKIDLLSTDNSGCRIREFDEEIQSFPSPIYYNNYPTSAHDIFSGDFNGDGLSELLIWGQEAGWELYQIVFSSPPTSIHTPTLELPTLPSLNDGFKVYVQDMNGDGFSDIITLKIMYSYGWYLYLQVFYSNGNEFSKFTKGFKINGVSNTNLDDAEIIFGDFTGDGNLEIKISKNLYYHQIIFPQKKQKKNNVMHKVADGFNDITCFEYAQITDPQAYDKGTYANSANTLTIKSGLSVLKYFILNFGTEDQSTTSYFYKTAKLHNKGLGFLGFEAVTSSRYLLGYNIPILLKEKSTYKLIASKHVVPDTVVYSIMRGNWGETHKMTESIFHYDFHNQYNDPDGFVTMPWLSGSTLIDPQKDDLTITTTYEVDDYGNILTETIDHNGEGTTTTTSIYTDAGSWCNYLPDYVTINRIRTGEQPYNNETDYIYRTDGLLQTERSYAHLVNSIDKSFDYDDFGNVTSTTLSFTGETPRSESFVYDPLGRFVTGKTNILGHQSFYTFDHRTGNMLSRTNIQGLKTIFQYDAFGRKTQTIYPDGNKSKSAMHWDTNNAISNILYYEQGETDGAPMQRIYYDRLGREVIRASQDLTNKMVLSKTLYDVNGRIDRVSEPYYEDASPTQWTTRHYDQFNRLNHVDYPTHTETTLYEGMTTTVTNTSTGISKSITTDGFGLTVSATDPTGTIYYDYYSSGLPRLIEAPDGSEFSMTYDTYDRQHTLSDPDAGTVNYEEYTGFGELMRQMHAGRTTETQYDDFGRPDITTHSYDGQTETIDYDYVEQGDGLGQIQSITQDNGISYHYSYDQYGRLKIEQEVIEGQTYQSTYAYDNFGNLYELTYPLGFKVQNLYDRAYLSEMRRGDNNALLYSLPQYNARGQLTNFMYGNGTQTILGYDAYGFPASHLVATGGVLYLNYGFDPATGNLNWRNDHTYRLNLSEDFSYDEYALHNRLTGWGESDQEQFSILYNPNGNIRCKTDISVYSPFAFQYSPTKPHAITQVYDITEDYKDFVEGQDQDIGYNAFDKTDYIAQGNKRIEFVYGPDQSRKIMKTYEKVGGDWLLKKSKYYILGNTEIEVDHQTGENRTLSYIANKAIWEQNTATGNQLYYLHQDYQGSLLAVTYQNGNVAQRYAYDPWGRRRDPGSWHNLTASEIEQENFLFARGYTGHEHLDAFGLINMNGRMYDPLLGRMLSPDNYVQAPDNSQNFNRYSYALNNPLVYTDPDGEWLHLLFGAIIGGTTNWLDHGAEFSAKGLGYFGIGALAGSLSAGVASGVCSSLGSTPTMNGTAGFFKGFMGKATFTGTGFFSGAVSGAAGGITNGVIQGVGNSILEGSNLHEALFSRTGALDLAWRQGAMGFAMGGMYGGIDAFNNGKDFWSGASYHERGIIERQNGTYATTELSDNASNKRVPFDKQSAIKIEEGSPNIISQSEFTITDDQGQIQMYTTTIRKPRYFKSISILSSQESNYAIVNYVEKSNRMVITTLGKPDFIFMRGMRADGYPWRSLRALFQYKKIKR